MKRSSVGRLAGVIALTVILSACSGQHTPTSGTIGGVGRIPGNNIGSPATLAPNMARNVVLPPLQGPVINTRAKGNRVIMIGDSILAGVSSRYGAAMCNVMVPLGWQMELDAEAGRFIEFGRQVLGKRLSAGWDAAVVFLGTNYTGGADRYKENLSAIVTTLAPRPTLLLTTSDFRAKQAEVNGAIAEVASANPHVTVLDWGTISKNPGIVSQDKIHPSPEGNLVLVSAISQAFGRAPKSPGACLPTTYTDDSAVTSGIMPSTTVRSPVTSGPSTSSSITSVPVTTVASTTTLAGQ